MLWNLSLASMATHNSTLLVLGPYYSRDKVLLWLRQVLMFCHLVLSCAYGTFVLQIEAVSLPDTLPVACAWQYNFSSTIASSLST